MIPSFSRTQFPPGGWQYHDPRIGWTTPSPKGSTFDQTVRQIIEVRRKNPAIVVRHRLSLDPFDVGNELEAFTRMRCGMPADNPVPHSVMLPGMVGSSISGVSEIKKMALGTALMLAWERSKEPPNSLEEFTERSKVCGSCPMNDIAKLSEWRKSPIGSVADRKTTRIKSIAHREKPPIELGLCRGVFCPSQYLASMPLDRLRSRLKESEVAAMDPNCWLRE